MKRLLIAAVALCAVTYAVYAVWLSKPGSIESAGNNPTASETTATSPDSSSVPDSMPTAGAQPVPASPEPLTTVAPAPKKAAETEIAPPASTPKAEKAHHASHSKKPAKPH